MTDSPALSPNIGSGIKGAFRQADSQLQHIREQILQAAKRSEKLAIVGNGSKAFYGEPIASGAHMLEVNGYRGIVSYEPTELVITAKCGTPVAEIEQALEARNQVLAFEPPFEQSSIGGAVATGLSGPRRVSVGALKDFVLGAALVNGQGQWLSFGGTVMKNVAGYDVSRMLTGSMGIFGVIAEVSVKVLPKPADEQSLMIPMDQARALSCLNQWGGQPLPIAASSWFEDQLILRLAGASAAVDSAVKRFVKDDAAKLMSREEAILFWRQLRHQQHSFFGGFEQPGENKQLWRISLPSTAGKLDIKAKQWIEWGGALRWLSTSIDQIGSVTALREQVAKLGGSAMLYRGLGTDRMHPLPTGLMKIHQALKQQLDPQGLFNPNRMYPGL